MDAKPLRKSTAYVDAMRLQCARSIAAQCCLGMYIQVYKSSLQARRYVPYAVRYMSCRLNAGPLDAKACMLTHVGPAACTHKQRKLSTGGSAMHHPIVSERLRFAIPLGIRFRVTVRGIDGLGVCRNFS